MPPRISRTPAVDDAVGELRELVGDLAGVRWSSAVTARLDDG
jgi:hypothetical protein